MIPKTPKINLNKRTGAEWRKLIDEVPIRTRMAVASIVWWDFFGNREVKERWNHLDDILGIVWPHPAKMIKPTHFHDAPKEEILEGLIQLGYSEKRARVKLSLKASCPERFTVRLNPADRIIKKKSK